MGVFKRHGHWEFRKTIRGVRYYEQIPEAQHKLEAEVAESDILKKIYEGRYGKDGQEIGSIDFARFARGTYLPSIKGRIKDTRKHECTVEILIKYFRGRKFREITAMLVEGYKQRRMSSLSKQGRLRHPASVKNEINILSSIFELAIDNDLAVKNPCRKVKWGKGQLVSRRDRVLTDAEERRLMVHLAAFPEVKAAVVIALHTGIRKSGILRLKRSDIDTLNRTATYTAKGGKRLTVPLNLEAWAMVLQLMRDPSEGFLFHNRRGNNLSCARGAFHLAMKRAEVFDFRFHDLRRTFATRVRESTSAWTARDLMGHADVKTTGLYVARSLSEMRAAVDSLARTG